MLLIAHITAASLACEPAHTSVSYSLCHSGVLAVYAVGAEPDEPMFHDLRGAAVLTLSDHLAVPVGEGWTGEGAGASATFWFGAFGPDGAFSGWSSDEVTLPDAPNTIRQDHRGGVGATSTPTSWSSCPDGAWILGEVESFDGPGARGCSTAASPAPVGGPLAVLLLLALRRRGPARGISRS